VHDLALHAHGGAPGNGDDRLLGLSLCSGAGGLDLGILLACPGYRTLGYVEREAYAAAVLVARMEDAALDRAPVWSDVATFDGRPWRGAVDILLAGYPCTPFSVAGRRLGAADSRHLWPHVARIVGEVEPPFVFLENVSHHLRLGFPEVAADLVGLGYRAAAGLFTAAEVGAPHRHAEPDQRALEPGRPASRRDDALRRDAALGDAGHPGRRPVSAAGDIDHRPDAGRTEGDGRAGEPGKAVDDADCAGPQGRVDQPREHAGERPAWPPGPDDAAGWDRYLRCAPDLEPSIRRGADGLAFRVDRLRLCGNGVVPLVAAHALRTLAAELLADG
jgi:DNA (cytosine-5)-methyltransferase 1